MVIKQEELSKREKRSFRNLVEYFTDMDANQYIRNVDIHSLRNSNMYAEKPKDFQIMIDEDEYAYNQIVKALQHTGITVMESWLENKINY